MEFSEQIVTYIKLADIAGHKTQVFPTCVTNCTVQYDEVHTPFEGHVYIIKDISQNCQSCSYLRKVALALMTSLVPLAWTHTFTSAYTIW